MCGAIALGVAGLVASAVGTGVSAYGQYEAGEAANEAAQATKEANAYNASILERNASQIDTAITDVKVAEKDALLQTGRAATAYEASQRASTAASGVQVDTGSTADVANSINLIANEDKATIRKNVANQIAQYKIEQANLREEAAMTRSSRVPYTSSGLQVGSTILTGAAQFSSNLANLGTSAKWW